MVKRSKISHIAEYNINALIIVASERSELKLKPEEFIDVVLIQDIKKVIDSGCVYIAFGLIAQGIETLGAFLDEQDMTDMHLAEKRFRYAVNKLFNSQGSKYIKYVSDGSEYDLYKYLRCGMSHILRPAGKLILTQKNNIVSSSIKHLDVCSETGGLYLVIEDLYDDFKKACIKCKHMLVKKTHPKVKDEYLICSPEGSGAYIK